MTITNNKEWRKVSHDVRKLFSHIELKDAQMIDFLIAQAVEQFKKQMMDNMPEYKDTKYADGEQYTIDQNIGFNSCLSHVIALLDSKEV